MSEYNFTVKADKYTYALMDVLSEIHGVVKGTHGGLMQEDIEHRVAWLQWRYDIWEPDSDTLFEPALKFLVHACLVDYQKWKASR